MRRIELAIVAVLVLVSAAYAMRRKTPAICGATTPSMEQSAAPSGDDKTPVIRFVKNPEMAPPLPDRDISGAVVSKANWNGKVVLVNFWATWCPPCREEIPELIELQNKYKDQLQVVSISEDDDPPVNVLKFAKRQ